MGQELKSLIPLAGMRPTRFIKSKNYYLIRCCGRSVTCAQQTWSITCSNLRFQHRYHVVAAFIAQRRNAVYKGTAHKGKFGTGSHYPGHIGAGPLLWAVTTLLSSGHLSRVPLLADTGNNSSLLLHRLLMQHLIK